MRRLLSVLGLCFFIVDGFSQGNLILKYRGLQDEVLVTAYVKACSATDNSDESIGRAYDYYFSHENEIIARYDAACYLQYLERLSDVRAANREAANQAISQLADRYAQIAAENRKLRELERQQEQELQMKKRAEMTARMANQPDRRAHSQTTTTSPYRIQNSGNQNSAYKTQGSYSDLLTSDPNWNQQVQMMVQQYGVEKTREIVQQKRLNDYNQSSQVASSQSQSQSERIISAVTSSRKQINLKIRGNSVVAYSNGIDQLGKQKWQPALGVSISRCGIGTPYDGSLAREFSYTAQINGTRIYFNM